MEDITPTATCGARAVGILSSPKGIALICGNHLFRQPIEGRFESIPGKDLAERHRCEMPREDLAA